MVFSFLVLREKKEAELKDHNEGVAHHQWPPRL